MPVNQTSFLNTPATKIRNIVECSYLNNVNDTWSDIGEQCPNEMFKDLDKPAQFVCCTKSLNATSFAVGIPIDWTASQTRRTVGLLLTLNIFCLIFMICGVLLDKFNIFQFDPKSTEKKKRPVRGGVKDTE